MFFSILLFLSPYFIFAVLRTCTIRKTNDVQISLLIAVDLEELSNKLIFAIEKKNERNVPVADGSKANECCLGEMLYVLHNFDYKLTIVCGFLSWDM